MICESPRIDIGDCGSCDEQLFIMHINTSEQLVEICKALKLHPNSRRALIGRFVKLRDDHELRRKIVQQIVNDKRNKQMDMPT